MKETFLGVTIAIKNIHHFVILKQYPAWDIAVSCGS